MPRLVQALDGVMRTTVTPDYSLRALVQLESSKLLAALGGSESALEPIPRRQAALAQEQGLVARSSEP